MLVLGEKRFRWFLIEEGKRKKKTGSLKLL